MKKKFSGLASRFSWELFKRTGKINYYLLYKNIEDSADLSLNNENNNELER